MHKFKLWGLLSLWMLIRCTATPVPPAPSPTSTPTPQPTPSLAPTVTPSPTVTVPPVELWLLTPTITPTEALRPTVTATARSPEWELPAPMIPDSLGVNIHFTQPEKGEMSRLQALGVRWVRKDFFWGEVEHERGKYDFSRYDALVTRLQANGLQPLFILDYGNALYDGGLSPHTDEGRAAFARFAATAARHYRGQAILWEIWNEPNLARFWFPDPNATDYGRLALTTARAMHRADPAAMVIAPAVVGFPWDFWRTIGQLGTLQQLNAVSVHPYGLVRPEDAQPHYRTLRRLLSQLNPTWDLPIIASESGYSTLTGGMTEQTQAAYVTRYWLVGMANDIPLSIWYDWRNNGTNPAELEENFGLVRHDFTPKPAYQAAQTLLSTLRGYRFMRRIPQPRAEDYLLLFQRDDSLALAAWTISETHAITLPLPPAALTLVTMSGQRAPLHGAQLTLKETPGYLLLEPTPPARRLGDWRPVTTLQVLHPQRPGVRVLVSNPFPEPRTATLEVWHGEEMLGTTTQTIPPERSLTLWIPIEPPEPSPEGTPLVIRFITPDVFFPRLQQAMIWLIQP